MHAHVYILIGHIMEHTCSIHMYNNDVSAVQTFGFIFAKCFLRSNVHCIMKRIYIYMYIYITCKHVCILIYEKHALKCRTLGGFASLYNAHDIAHALIIINRGVARVPSSS